MSRLPVAGRRSAAVTCGFCGLQFHPQASEAACAACLLGGHCSMLRCPHCGYENPREPGWISGLRRLWGRRHEA